VKNPEHSLVLDSSTLKSGSQNDTERLLSQPRRIERRILEVPLSAREGFRVSYFWMTTAVLTLIIVASVSTLCQQNSSLVNFQHLQHLTERIAFAGDSVDIVHIYANAPDYAWVDAKESGPEGIACVDDAARAAVVYLRHYELTKDKESLARAKAILKFVMKMQANDGEFYNFIFPDHSINRDGKTSFKSFGWWAARGVWCMALGERLFKSVDPQFAEQLHRGVERALPHIDGLLKNYGKEKIVNEYRIPQWLFYESGADATTELCLGLIEHYKSTRSPKVKNYIEKLSDGLMVLQDGDATKYPFGLHRSWESMWHMWGNGQSQVLASAGKLLKSKKMIESAEREAKGFYSRLLIQGFMKEMDVAAPEKKIEYEQIAYGLRPMVVGLIRLYEATGKSEYLKMAGLAGSWFFGNNTLHQQMYDPATGRCFDGLTDSISVNKNSGAESTIEALHSMIELERFPQAMKYLSYHKVKSGETSDYVYGVFENSSGNQLTLALDLKKSKLMVLEGEKSQEFLKRLL